MRMLVAIFGSLGFAYDGQRLWIRLMTPTTKLGELVPYEQDVMRKRLESTKQTQRRTAARKAQRLLEGRS